MAAICAAQTGPAGHWEGTLKLNDREIGLAFDLAQNDKGAWIASFGVPAQNVTGLRVAELVVNSGNVKFTCAELPNNPAFELKLAEGKLAGTIGSSQGSLPIEFKRTGEAKVELPASSPAVPKELEGDWTGSLQVPNGALELVVHFKNQPDNTVLATLDSPTQGAAGLRLDDVKQAGSKVEFALKRFRGAFTGTMSKDNKQIEGQWSQGENSLPLVLKKK